MQSHHSGSGQRRRRGNRSRSSSRQRSGDTFKVRREPRKPESFWDKVRAFFGLSAKPAGRESRPARQEIREPREPRAQRAPRESRKPEAVEVTTPRLYVGNLSYDATESDLFELFSGVGTVANVEIISNKHTERSKGFGFVQMNSVAEAKRAVEELHDKDYMGRKLVVSGAKLPPDRTIGRERGESQGSAEAAGAAVSEEPASAPQA